MPAASSIHADGLERAAAWRRRRTYHHAQYTPARVAQALAGRTVSAIVPTRECAATIGGTLAPLIELSEEGVIDQLVVVDAGSDDGTPELAAAVGAEVFDEDSLLSSFGPTLGKGDALWRALSVARGDLIVFLDADSEDFDERFPLGLLGPLTCEVGVRFAKACFRRPFRSGGVDLPDGGGRVTELTARPLLNAFFPELAGFDQPLAGEIAASRELLVRVPFTVGYGVETAMLIDIWGEVGLDAMAQADVDRRQNSHQTLHKLVPMSQAVLQVVALRLQRAARLGEANLSRLGQPQGETLELSERELVERPPLVSVRLDAA